MRKEQLQELEKEEETWLSLWMHYDRYFLRNILLQFLPMAIQKKWTKCLKVDQEDEEQQRCIYNELKVMKKDKAFQEALQFYKSVEEYKQIYDKYGPDEYLWLVILFHDSNVKNKLFQQWKKEWRPWLISFETMIDATKRFNFKMDFWKKLENDTDKVVSSMNQLTRMDGTKEMDALKNYRFELKRLRQKLYHVKDHQELQQKMETFKQGFSKQIDTFIETFKRGIDFVKVSPKMTEAFKDTIYGLRNLKKTEFDEGKVLEQLQDFVIKIKRASEEVQTEVKDIFNTVYESTEVQREIDEDEEISGMIYRLRDAIGDKTNVRNTTETLLEYVIPGTKSMADRIYTRNYLSTLKTKNRRKLFVLLTVGTGLEIDVTVRDLGWRFITNQIIDKITQTENARDILNQIVEDVKVFEIMMEDYFANLGSKRIVALTKEIIQEVFAFKKMKTIQSLSELGEYLIKSILKTKPEEESVKPKLMELNQKLKTTFETIQRRGGSFSDTVASLGAQVLKGKMKELANWLNQKKPQIVNAVNQSLAKIIPIATQANPAEMILPLLYVVQPELLVVKQVPLGETVMKAIINYSVKQALNNLKDLPNYVNSVLTTVIQKLNEGDIDGLKKMISF